MSASVAGTMGGKLPSSGAARRRREQHDRAVRRHVCWLTGVLQAGAHHTVPQASSLAALVDGLSREVDALRAQVVEIRAQNYGPGKDVGVAVGSASFDLRVGPSGALYEAAEDRAAKFDKSAPASPVAGVTMLVKTSGFTHTGDPSLVKTCEEGHNKEEGQNKSLKANSVQQEKGKHEVSVDGSCLGVGASLHTMWEQTRDEGYIKTWIAESRRKPVNTRALYDEEEALKQERYRRECHSIRRCKEKELES